MRRKPWIGKRDAIPLDDDLKLLKPKAQGRRFTSFDPASDAGKSPFQRGWESQTEEAEAAWVETLGALRYLTQGKEKLQERKERLVEAGRNFEADTGVILPSTGATAGNKATTKADQAQPKSHETLYKETINTVKDAMKCGHTRQQTENQTRSYFGVKWKTARPSDFLPPEDDFKNFNEDMALAAGAVACEYVWKGEICYLLAKQAFCTARPLIPWKVVLAEEKARMKTMAAPEAPCHIYWRDNTPSPHSKTGTDGHKGRPKPAANATRTEAGLTEEQDGLVRLFWPFIRGIVQQHMTGVENWQDALGTLKTSTEALKRVVGLWSDPGTSKTKDLAGSRAAFLGLKVPELKGRYKNELSKMARFDRFMTGVTPKNAKRVEVTKYDLICAKIDLFVAARETMRANVAGQTGIEPDQDVPQNLTPLGPPKDALDLFDMACEQGEFALMRSLNDSADHFLPRLSKLENQLTEVARILISGHEPSTSDFQGFVGETMNLAFETYMPEIEAIEAAKAKIAENPEKARQMRGNVGDWSAQKAKSMTPEDLKKGAERGKEHTQRVKKAAQDMGATALRPVDEAGQQLARNMAGATSQLGLGTLLEFLPLVSVLKSGVETAQAARAWRKWAHRRDKLLSAQLALKDQSLPGHVVPYVSTLVNDNRRQKRKDTGTELVFLTTKGVVPFGGPIFGIAKTAVNFIVTIQELKEGQELADRLTRALNEAHGLDRWDVLEAHPELAAYIAPDPDTLATVFPELANEKGRIAHETRTKAILLKCKKLREQYEAVQRLKNEMSKIFTMGIDIDDVDETDTEFAPPFDVAWTADHWLGKVDSQTPPHYSDRKRRALLDIARASYKCRKELKLYQA